MLGLVGAGLQAIAHVDALSRAMKLREVKVWSRTRRTSEKFLKRVAEKYSNANFAIADTVEKAVRGSDVVVTLTPSKQPIVLEEWVGPGTHINAIGADAPRKQELDPSILKRAKIVVDELEHASHSGEINVPLAQGLIDRKDVYGEIGEIILGKKLGRASPNEITVFASTGIAIQDVATAQVVYTKALKEGFGMRIDLTGPTSGLI